jgi:Fe-S cluster assembly protein SufD
MSAPAERIFDELAATPRGSSATAPLRAALARGLPTTRDENWKYAALRGLDKVRLTSVAPPAPALEAARAMLPARLDGHARVVLVDGHLAPSLSDPLPARLRFESAAMPGAPAGTQAIDGSLSGDSRWAAVNAAFAAGALVLDAEAAMPLALEICCVTTLTATAGGAHPRLSLRLAPAAQVTVIERQLSTATASALTNVAIDIELGAGSTLRHLRLQTHGDHAQHVETLRVRVGADAHYQQLHVVLGAQATRTTGRIELTGRGAGCAVRVASIADGSRVHDNFYLIDHQAPQTQTLHWVRGIAADRARVAFNGHIRMAAGAVGAASDQSLRGLQSGAQCEIDLRPQLEIYVDAVKASHGATVGKLDEQMLFYLLSRGIDRDTAQGLLKWAFVADVLTHLPDIALRRQVERELGRHLGDAPNLLETP